MHDEQQKINLILSQAKSLADEGKYLHALQLYDKLLSEKMTIPEPFIQCANLYLDNGQVGAAVKTLEDALILFPTDEYIFYRLGILFQKTEQYHKSIALLKKISKRHNIAIQYALGIAYLKITDYKKAKDHFKVAHKSNPKYKRVNIHLAETLLKLNLFAESLKYFKNEIKLNPNDWGSYYYQGIAYLHLIDYKKAFNAFESANKIEPHNKLSITKSGECLLGMKEYAQAINYINLALSFDPDFIDALIVLGRLHYTVGDYGSANAVLVRASNIEPQNMLIRSLYKKVLSKRI